MDSKRLAALIANSVEVCEEAAIAPDATSQFGQTAPGAQTQMANPLSPILGDSDFFTYMLPGSVFEAHDGSQWTITAYEWDSRVEIQNRWYPRQVANVTTNDVRRSIAMWVEPVNVKVPAPLSGVKYN
jgi:hypothetical protein